MTPERWKEIERVFEAALSCPPPEREALLRAACGDEELRQAVEALLAADESAARFMEAPAAVLAAGESEDKDAPPAAQVGAYRLVQKIGEGGMSVVHAAVRDDDVYQKRVAIKFFRVGIERPELLKRFRIERQILAGLDHPFVAKLLDGGSTAGGAPYIIMEYVEGLPIDAFCERHGLSIPARLELFRKVCSAVQYAHTNLVVHRDIKPSNILVRSDGEPKLLDFGIAKLLNPELYAVGVEPTRFDACLMTPEYASPEQIRGEPVSTATDVYSLGVLLYRLLTGRAPYDLGNRSLADVLRTVCEEEPLKPSAAALSAGDSQDSTSRPPRGMRAGLKRRLAEELDNIVLKAMSKEPQRRYGSAEQLSEDLRRHIVGLPVIAQSDTFTYRTGKFVRRHPVAVAFAALFAIVVGGFVVTTEMQSRRLARALAQTETEAARAKAVTQFLQETLGSANPFGGKGRAVTVLEVLESTVERIDTSFTGQPETEATVRATIGATYRDLGRYEKAQPLLEKALEIRRQLYRGSHPETAESLIDLGRLLAQKGDFARSEALYREALAIQELLFGGDSLEAARALHGLGTLLRRKGELLEADEVLRRALAVRRSPLPTSHVDVARNARDLASVLREKGEFEPAEALAREAVQTLRRTPSVPAPELAAALSTLAIVLDQRGDPSGAEHLFREVLAMHRSQLGEEHTVVADSMNNLASVLCQKGDFAGAAQLLRDAASIFEKVLGPESLGVAAASGNLGAVLAETGDYAGAEAMYRKAIAIHRKHFGPDHIDLADDLGNLGEVLARAGNHDEAERILREAVAMKRRSFGASHLETLVTMNNLANLLRERGKRQESLALFEEALRLFPETAGSDHQLAASCRSDYGALLLDLGRYPEARTELLSGYLGVKKAAGGREDKGLRRAREHLQRLAKVSRNPKFTAEVEELLRK